MYRSEMGFDEQDRRDDELKEQNRKALIKGLRAAIKKGGIEEVLAFILTEGTSTSRWHFMMKD